MVTIKQMGGTMKRAMQWLATAAVAAVMASPAAASTITYYHNDLAGSPVVATNSSAQVIWRESYRPYGERLTKSAASKPNDVWFTSRRQDSTGLVYMGARYYDPVTGRFVSTDPKGFDETDVQSFNRYEYANDNPYRYVDPNGRESMAIRAQERAQISYLRGDISRKELNELYQAQELGASVGLLIEGAVAGVVRMVERATAEGLSDSALAAQNGKQVSTNAEKAIDSLRSRIAEHRQKLQDYLRDPEAFDNQGVLRDAPSAEIRQKIIDGRARHLENEIGAFEKGIRDLGGEP